MFPIVLEDIQIRQGDKFDATNEKLMGTDLYDTYCISNS